MVPKSLPSGLTTANRMFPICVHAKVPELGNTRVLLVDTGFRKRSCSTKRLERGDSSKRSHHALSDTRSCGDMSSKHVAVLMGGWSAERDVSLRSGAACADALRRVGYQVTPVDVGRDVATVLASINPDVALNVLHGRPGEDGTIQGVLEILGIPYSHSGVLASALAMQKDRAKVTFREAGVPTPEGTVVSRFEAAKSHVMAPPYVIKPIAEGSSVGVFIITDEHAHPPQELYRDDWSFGEFVLCERYIAGKELTCAVLGEEALDVIEIVPTLTFYDYEE